MTPEPRQLLPKDILQDARMFSGQEAEEQILAAIRRPSVYSHYNNTNQWMNPAFGTSTGAPFVSSSFMVTSTAVFSTAGNFTTIQWNNI